MYSSVFTKLLVFVPRERIVLVYVKAAHKQYITVNARNNSDRQNISKKLRCNVAVIVQKLCEC